MIEVNSKVKVYELDGNDIGPGQLEAAIQNAKNVAR